MLSNLYPLFSQFLLQLRASDPHSGMLATSTKAGGGAEGASTESADDARTFIKLSKMAEVGRKRGAERGEGGLEVRDKMLRKSGTEDEKKVSAEDGENNHEGEDGLTGVAEKQPGLKKYPCPNCNNLFGNMGALTNHFKKCYVLSDKGAGMAGGVGEKEEKFEEVVKEEDKAMFPCQLCGKIFFSLIGLNIHKGKYCKNQPTQQFSKEEMDMEVDVEVGTIEDQESDPEWEMSDSKSKSKKDRSSGKLQPFKCPVHPCKRRQLDHMSMQNEGFNILRFSRTSHIPDHLRSDHGAAKLQCNLCEKEFNGRATLGRHFKKVHNIESGFKQAEAINRHSL